MILHADGSHDTADSYPSGLSGMYRRKMSDSYKTKAMHYEEPDGEPLRTHFRQKSKRKEYWDSFSSYLICIVISIVIALFYTFMESITEIAYDLRKTALATYFKNGTGLGIIWVFAISTSLALTVTTALVIYFEPSVAGSGMPEVISYLNGVRINTYFTWRVLALKIACLTTTISAGMVTGDDGPFALVGTITAVMLNKLMGRLKFIREFFQTGQPAVDMILSKRSNHIIASTGAAAGFAAAFRAPLGGVLFVLEEAISYFHPLLILKTIFTTFITYMLAGWFRTIIHPGDSLNLTSFSHFRKDADCKSEFEGEDLLAYVIMGIAAGLLGSLNKFIRVTILRLHMKYLNNRPFLRILEVALVTIVTLSVMILIPAYNDECIPYARLFKHIEYRSPLCKASCETEAAAFTQGNAFCFEALCLPNNVKARYFQTITTTIARVQQECITNSSATASLINTTSLTAGLELPHRFITDNELKCFFPMRSLFWVSPFEALRNIMARGMYDIYSPQQLALYGVVYYILSLVTYNIMLPIDSISPTLIIGAVMGRLFGIVVNDIRVRANYLAIDPGVFALLGSMTFWSGTSQLALAAILVAIESSLDLDILPALITSVVISVLVAGLFGHGLYHAEIHVRDIPFLQNLPPNLLKTVTIGEIMNRELVTLNEFETKGRISNLAAHVKHSGFPVVMKETQTAGSLGKLVGFVLTPQLKMITGKSISDTQDDNQVHLTDIMNKPPYSVNQTMTAHKAYQMFRSLKLKHMCIVDDYGYLVGMVTRADFNSYIHKHKHSH